MESELMVLRRFSAEPLIVNNLGSAAVAHSKAGAGSPQQQHNAENCFIAFAVEPKAQPSSN
jgi:hypothetical protein